MKNYYKTLFLILFAFGVLNFNVSGQSDGCSLATPLTIHTVGNCVMTLGTTIGATQTIPGCAGTADDDVWYQFTPGTTSLKIKVVGDVGFDPVIQVFSGPCSLLANEACVDNSAFGGTETFSSTNFVIGNTYRIRVYSWGTGTTTKGNFNICVTEAPTAPSNDNCSGAINLSVNNACVPVAFNNDWATQSGPGCAGTADDDVWFKFTATNAVQEITIDPSIVGTGLMDPVVELHDGTCSDPILVCKDGTGIGNAEVINAVGLTPGKTYYFRVYDYYSNWYDSFQVCVKGSPTPAPTNDEPCAAIQLPTVTSACSFLTFDNIGATASNSAPTPVHNPAGPCEGGSSTGYHASGVNESGDVWFKVTVPSSGNINITMEPNLGGAAITDGVMILYKGSCGSLIPISYSNDYSCYPILNGSGQYSMQYMPYISKSGLTPGATLYIRFYEWDTNLQGDFGLCVSSATNDNCSSALYICDINGYKGSTGAYYSPDFPGNMHGNNEDNTGVNLPDGTNSGGPFGYYPPSNAPGPFSSSSIDVNIENNSWIRFTANASTVQLNVSVYDCFNGGYPLGGVQMQIFSASNCINFNPVSSFEENSTGFTITASGLTVGDDYLLMIDGFAGDICSYTISAKAGVKFPDIPTPAAVCPGDKVTLTAPSGASSYEWQFNGSTSQSVDVFPQVATTYECVVEGLCDHKQTLKVTVPIKPSPIIYFNTGRNPIICDGKTISITANGANSYTWITPSHSGATISVSPSATTTYKVKGTTSGCEAIREVTVHVNDKPSLITAPTPSNSNCNASTGSLTGISIKGASSISYTWKDASNNVVGNSADLTGQPAGDYTLYVTDGNGCQNSFGPFTISNYSPPSPPTASTQSFCGSTTIGNLTAVGSNIVWYANSSGGTPLPNSHIISSNGTYYSTQSTHGCESNRTTVAINIITIPSLPSISITAPTCSNNGSASISNYNSSYSYTITPSGSSIDGSGNILGLTPASNYTIKAKNGTCSSTAVNFSIGNKLTVPSRPTINIGLASCSSQGTATITNYGGAYTYVFSPTGPSVNGSGGITGATAGQSYTVYANNGSCDSKGESFNIAKKKSVPSSPTINISTPSCSASGGGVVSNYNSSYSYTFSPAGPSVDGSGNIMNANYGQSYTMTAKNTTSGCTSLNSSSFTIDQKLTKPNKPIASNQDFCDVATINDLNATGTGTNTIYWYSSSLATTPLSGTDPLVDGNTYYTAQTNGTCESDRTSILVTIDPLPILTFLTSDANCIGDSNGSATVSSSNTTGPYTYVWNDPSNQTTDQATGLSAGTYQVTVTDGNSCVKTGAVTISEPSDTLSITVTKKTKADCSMSNGSATISVLGGNGGYSYSWNTTPVQTGNNATGLAAGPYIVTVTDSKGCQRDQIVNISNPNSPSITIDGSNTNNVTCAGESNGKATVKVTGGTGNYTYTWSPTVPNTGSSASNLADGSYTVTVADAANCSASKTIIIGTDNPKPKIAPSVDVSVICSGKDLQFHTNPTDAGTSPNYHWSGPNGFTSSSEDPLLTGVGINADGTYTLYVIGDGGCSSDTLNIGVTVNSLPQLNISGDSVTCYNYGDGAATVTATGNGGFTYIWDDSNSQTTGVATNLTPGTYKVVVTDINNCIDSASVQIKQPDTLQLTSSSTDSQCTKKDGTATVIPTGGNGGYTYLWNTTPPQNTAVASNLGEGTYKVTVTDSKGCSNTIQVSVDNPAAPSISIDKIVDVTCAGKKDGSVTISATGGTGSYVYQWKPTGGNATTANNLPAGTYTVTVTDAAGCSSTSTVTINTVNPIPVLNIGTTTPIICENKDIHLSVSVTNGGGNPTYSWTGPNGFTSGSQNPILIGATKNATGEYIVTVTSATGCVSKPDTINITVEANPIAVAGAQPTEICKNEDIHLLASSSNGGSNLTYAWSGGNNFVSSQQNPIIQQANQNDSGVYSVIITSGTGCVSDAAKVNILIHPLPKVDTSTSFEEACSGESIVLRIQHPNANYTYVWTFDNNDIGTGTTYSISEPSIAQSGVYLVYAQTAEGCKALVQKINLDIDACAIDIVEVFSPNGDDVNDYFHVKNLKAYPNTQVWIYTRWGLKVYQSEDYQNDWSGTSQSDLNIGGDQLPEGTYYYLLKLGGEENQANAGETYKGYVYIKR